MTMTRQGQSVEFAKGRYYAYLRSLKPGVHNIKVHVGFVDRYLEDIMGKTSLSIRQADYDVWSSAEN